MRFYFYDEDKNQLKDHPLHGCSSSACGAAIFPQGVMPDGKSQILHKGLIQRTHLSTFKDQRITIADFPGYSRVLVKNWAPKAEHTEWFWLTSEDVARKDVPIVSKDVAFQQAVDMLALAERYIREGQLSEDPYLSKEQVLFWLQTRIDAAKLVGVIPSK